MRRRDWFGSVFVVALGGLAGYLRGLAMPTLGGVAVLAAIGVVWDIGQERGWLGLRKKPNERTTIARHLPGPGLRVTVGLSFGDVGMQTPVMSPGPPVGDLPVRVDMHGLVGKRDGDRTSTRWVWEVEDCVVASHANEPLFFRAWLKIPVARQRGATEIEASASLVRLEPHGHERRHFEFEQRLFAVESAAEKHPPGTLDGPMELWFLEVGTERTWRVAFHPPRWGPAQPSIPKISSTNQT